MQISDIGNVPVEFTIEGKAYKVKRLSLLNVQGLFQSKIRTKYMDDIVHVASMMKNGDERIKFQREAMKDIPKGVELDELSTEKMNTIEGGIEILHIVLSELNEISYQDINEIASKESNQAVITSIISYVTGSDVELKMQNEDEDDKDNKDESGVEKKTKKKSKKQLTGVTQ